MSGSSAGLDSSPSSSTDSSSSVCYPSFQHSTSVNPSFTHRRCKRDLKLDLSISCPSAENNIHSSFLSSVGTATNPKNKNKDDEQPGRPSFLFVKVYMEGVAIGRKLDLYALHTYHDLLVTLSHMFNTSIYSYEDIDNCRARTFNCSILTYQDKDRDWMMVGDVPWELFLITVKRLKITNPYCWSHRLPHLCDTNGVSQWRSHMMRRGAAAPGHFINLRYIMYN